MPQQLIATANWHHLLQLIFGTSQSSYKKAIRFPTVFCRQNVCAAYHMDKESMPAAAIPPPAQTFYSNKSQRLPTLISPPSPLSIACDYPPHRGIHDSIKYNDTVHIFLLDR